jgi:hypothetical protein
MIRFCFLTYSMLIFRQKNISELKTNGLARKHNPVNIIRIYFQGMLQTDNVNNRLLSNNNHIGFYKL